MTTLVPSDGKSLRHNTFDAIRLGMALLVVWSHSFALWWGSEDDEPLSRLLNGTYNSGNIAVLVFFAISGFLITISYLRSRSWRDYLKRRIVRIHPGYLVAVTLCSLVVVPAFSTRDFGDVQAHEALGMMSNIFLRNYIISADTFGGRAVNGSIWSIPFEFWCYLGILALGVTGLIRRRLVFILLPIAIMLIRAWSDYIEMPLPGGGRLGALIGWLPLWANVLPPFMLGGAAYLYRELIPRSRALLAGSVCVFIAASHLLDPPARNLVAHLLLPPLLVYAVLFAAFSPASKLHDAARFGDFSYGTYLYAFPIQQILVYLGRDTISFPIFVLLSMLLSLAAGVASWFLIERWFLQRVRRKPVKPLDEEIAIVAP